MKDWIISLKVNELLIKIEQRIFVRCLIRNAVQCESDMKNDIDVDDVARKANAIFGSAAGEVSWAPATANSSSANEFVLEEVEDSEGFVLRQDPFFTLLFFLIFMISAVGIFVHLLFAANFNFILLIVSIMFGCVAVRLGLSDTSRVVVAAKSIEVYRDKLFGGGRLIGEVGSDQIKSIQILIKLYVGIDSSFYNYELNLVRADGGRINTIFSPDPDFVRSVAEKLSGLISAPIWDMSGKGGVTP